MRLRLTPSRFDAAQRCAWPFRSDVDVPEEERGPDARLGTAVHAVIAGASVAEAALRFAVDADAIDQLVAVWRSWARETGLPADVRREVAIAYDPATDTARELSGTDRDYSGARPGEIPGTVDVLWLENGVLYVGDYKTGRQADLPPAPDSWQLALYGLATARLFGVDEVRVGFVLLDADAGWSEDWHTIGADALAAIRERLVATIAAIPDARPQPGPQCGDCRAAAVCPAAANALTLVTNTEPVVGLVTAENAGRVLVACDLAEKRIAELRRQAKEVARAVGTIDGHDGRPLRLVSRTTTHPTLEGPEGAAFEAWLDERGWSEAIETVPAKRLLTWSRIREHFGAEAERQAREKATELGATRTGNGGEVFQLAEKRRARRTKGVPATNAG